MSKMRENLTNNNGLYISVPADRRNVQNPELKALLKVETDDNVDEILNRRALYILASRSPASSGELPRRNWKKL